MSRKVGFDTLWLCETLGEEKRGIELSTHGLDAQMIIYGNSLSGKTYDVPLSWKEWQEKAEAQLAAGPWWYVEGGAGEQETMSANRDAFLKYQIRPRMLRNVADRDIRVTLFGVSYPAPFLFAPIGVQSIIHHDAERAPARAAAKMGIPFVLSTVSSVSVEEIATEMGQAPRWFQLYPGKDEQIVASMIQRAEASGYSALVVTVDTTMLGWRMSDLRNAYLPFLQGEGIINFVTDPYFHARLGEAKDNPEAIIREFLDVYVNPSFTWEHLRDVRAQTKLPLLVKGLTHPEDAIKAFEIGADGIIVSNHGGRQVDGAISALDALVEVRNAVGTDATVLMDSGIRTAADILKAKALGADAVLMGRPYAYAMAVGGQTGIEQWAHHLLAELDLEMALAGYARIADVDSSFVKKVGV